MEIFARITGGSLAEADMARRAIIKSKVGDPDWEREIGAARDMFLERASGKGVSPAIANKIWEELFSHVRYSFNRAHAVAYCVISWELAWWKLYYTALFFATMMDVDPTEFQTYLFDAVNHGLEVKTPHINRSSHVHIHEGNTIYLPLGSVKHLGYEGARKVFEERSKSPFASYKDLNARVARRALNSRARKALYLLGGFKDLPGNPIDAGIDTLKLDDIGEPEHVIQQKYLGAMVPSADIIRLIERKKSEGFICGIVTDRKRKESRFGVYEVHYLTPSGIFWTRELAPVKIGKVVAVKTSMKTGKAISIQEL
jgi:hypothetical protein